MVFDFDTEIKRQTGTDGMEDFKTYATCSNKDFQKAVRYLGNLSGYMQGVRFTKGGR